MTSQPMAPVSADAIATTATKRPTTLLVALVVAAVAALATLVNGILMKSGGQDLAIEILAEATGVDAAGIDSSVRDTWITQSMVDTLDSRAMISFVLGGLLLVFTVLMRGAATWARVVVTILAAANILLAGLIAGDDGSGSMLLLALLGVLASIGTLVAVWLPANGKYAKQLKTSR